MFCKIGISQKLMKISLIMVNSITSLNTIHRIGARLKRRMELAANEHQKIEETTNTEDQKLHLFFDILSIEKNGA